MHADWSKIGQMESFTCVGKKLICLVCDVEERFSQCLQRTQENNWRNTFWCVFSFASLSVLHLIEVEHYPNIVARSRPTSIWEWRTTHTHTHTDLTHKTNKMVTEYRANKSTASYFIFICDFWFPECAFSFAWRFCIKPHNNLLLLFKERMNASHVLWLFMQPSNSEHNTIRNSSEKLVHTHTNSNA